MLRFRRNLAKKPTIFTMKYIIKSILAIAILFSLSSCGSFNFPTGGTNQPSGGSGQNIPQTNTGRSADQSVVVRNIQLTKDYTILSLRYNELKRPQYDQQGRRVVVSTIAFRSDAVLIAANGARRFRVVRIEGIPIYPKEARLYGNEQVDFVVYFERLDKGLENFDLFECNDFDHLICWNVYNLFVSNPADVYVPQPQPQPTTIPTQTPAPTTTPTPVPSTNTQTNLPPKKGKQAEVDTPTPPTPEPVVMPVTITGVVKDAKSNRPLSATIDYKLSSNKISVDSVQSFNNTGAYRISLAKGQVYTMVVSAPGYLPLNDALDLSKATSGQKITKDIQLTPLTVGDKITLKNIYFEISKSDLLPASYAELDKLVTMMNDNYKMSIRLEGHTDIVGDSDLNLKFSQDRVKACQEYLVKKGINWNRIEAVGYGDTRPIIKKGTDEERKVNRRVEFVILKI